MNPATKRFLAIVAGAIALACTLGICLDMVTANVAVEYFTLHHPRIVDSERPVILAFVWGIGASWWFGAIFGAIIGIINNCRPQPLRPIRILRWVAIACCVLWLIMVAIVVLVLAVAASIPEEVRRPTFDCDRRVMAVAIAHQFEYVLGAIAGTLIAIMTWWAKNRGVVS